LSIGGSVIVLVDDKWLPVAGPDELPPEAFAIVGPLDCTLVLVAQSAYCGPIDDDKFCLGAFTCSQLSPLRSTKPEAVEPRSLARVELIGIRYFGGSRGTFRATTNFGSVSEVCTDFEDETQKPEVVQGLIAKDRCLKHYR
jgi:hypothetical protein